MNTVKRKEAEPMPDDTEYGMFCAGPLNLDMQAEKASTFYGDILSIDEKAFHALYQLAANEGTALTFEHLYFIIWGGEKSQTGRETARAALDDLMERVNAAGHGLMSMEYAPEVGYVFQTIWPRNRPVVNMPVAVPDEKNTSETVTPKRRGRRRVALLFGAGAVAIVLITVLAAPGLFKTGIEFEDEQVPLAAPDFGNEIVYPVIEMVTIPADTAEVAIPLHNRSGNFCNMVFEIALSDTGEILFISEQIAPGTGADTVRLNRPLEAGEYKATLIVRAYDVDGFEEKEVENFEFLIVAK